MKLINAGSKGEMGLLAADIFAEGIREKPNSVLGLATGSTPLPLYRELIERFKDGKLDFSEISTINLDEYAGLPGTHDQSYRYFMNENLFNHINVKPENTHVPDGTASDPKAECARYDKLIENMGGIDLQLLGIGFNGHLAFCEPSDTFSNKTQYIKLAETTIDANARFFSDHSEVPKYAFSMGIRDIMLARKILLVAGAEKKDIVEKVFKGEITPQVPASVLQMHKDATIIIIKE
jgi:glucosamine-6-phosphate deaminase